MVVLEEVVAEGGEGESSGCELGEKRVVWELECM